MGAGQVRAGRPAGRWPEHRVRSRRPARRGARADAVALRCVGRLGGVTDYSYREPAGADKPVRQPAAQPRRRQGRPGVLAARPGSGAVCHRARHAEEHQRVLPAVRGVRSRADPRPDAPGGRAGAGDQPAAVRAEGGPDPRRAARPEACAGHRRGTRPARHDRRWTRRSRRPSAEFDIPPTDPEDMALLHFTSGTTGKPKGAMHVHEAVVAHHATRRVRAGPARRRRVLVHRRPGLGDRHLVRDHRARSPTGPRW